MSRSKWEKTWSIRSHKLDNNCLNNQVKDKFQFEIAKEPRYNKDGDVAFYVLCWSQRPEILGLGGDLFSLTHVNDQIRMWYVWCWHVYQHFRKRRTEDVDQNGAHRHK